MIRRCRNCGQDLHRRFGRHWYHDHHWQQCDRKAMPGLYADPISNWWSFWVGHTNAGPVVMWIKNLIHILGRRLDLHMMVASDKPGCFHTHPAKALRVILWTGYVEELGPGLPDAPAEFVTWKPGMIGWVYPETCHRIDRLLGKRSISLWIRGRVTHEIELRGDGWNA